MVICRHDSLVDLFTVIRDAQLEGKLLAVAELLAEAGDAACWYSVLAEPPRLMLIGEVTNTWTYGDQRISITTSTGWGDRASMGWMDRGD